MTYAGRRLGLVGLVVALVLLVLGSAPVGAADRQDYIVVLDPSVVSARAFASEQAQRLQGRIGFVYERALKGFTLSLTARQAEWLAAQPFVESIEPDAIVEMSTTQSGATWGLDRIDQRSRPLSGTFTYNATGAGVTAYVIDTGIRFSHTQFGGRAVSGFDAVDGGSADDCNGHGTHVSGTVGGSTYGVAKNVSLIAVRVLDCGGGGTWEGVIAGVDWVTANHSGPSVANMSIQGGKVQSVNDAITNSINSGVVYAVAAANFSDDACLYSPASTPLAITVGATTISDSRASFSNYGTCLDIFAPGENITSDWSSSDTATNTISGTSMASPHVAGVAALYLSKHPGATTTQVRDAIVNNATNNKVTNPGTGSPNKLLFSKVNKFS